MEGPVGRPVAAAVDRLGRIGRPEIGILDELTAGVDPQGRRDTYELVEGLRDNGVTVVLVTHLMEDRAP